MFKRLLIIAIALAIAALAITALTPQKAPAQESPHVSVPQTIKNMYHPDRFPDIYLLTKPNCAYINAKDYERVQKGQNPSTVGHHGSPWAQDRQIPLFFYGKGIRKSHIAGTAKLVDLAPTVAYLMGGQGPSATSGRVLHEILTPETAHWGPKQRPKVVVLFSLDQCRRDHFGLFAPALPFIRQRIVAQGAFFTNAHLTYAQTATAVSHATAGTGAIPAHHGIIGNNITKPDGTFSLSIDDGHGPDPGHGELSPKNILVPTLADEIDLQYGNRCHIQASSNYARAAIGIAGHGAFYKQNNPQPDRDTVFAFNAHSGLPYTNTAFYRLPPSLDAQQHPQVHIKRWLAANYDLHLDKTRWTPALKIVDKSPYAAYSDPIKTSQGRFPWGAKYHFDHPLTDPAAREPYPLQRHHQYAPGKTQLSNRYLPAIYTPFFELWAFDMNLRAIHHDKVGRDTVPDLVFFHLKNLDKISHRYGVRSPELFDYLHYADYLVQKVVHYLDGHVGKDAYTLAFFADHGGHNVQAPGQYIVQPHFLARLEQQFGPGLVRAFASDQLWLDPAALARANTTTAQVAHWMEQNFPWLLKAYTKDQVAR